MDEITMPDFSEWAKSILDREDVAIALEQAFNQGHSLGYRCGYDKCKREILLWPGCTEGLWRYFNEKEEIKKSST